MKTLQLTENIYILSANDRNTHLFENLWPTDSGVCYNCYLIVDEKIALIDTIEKSFVADMMQSIKKIIGNRKIDYHVINHMEPDHSAGIAQLVNAYPEMKLIGNKMTFHLLRGFYGVCTNTLQVEDSSELSLGKFNLRFYMTPWLHWPETMMTFETNTKIMFSGDAFGSFGSLDGGVFDDEVNLKFYEDEMLRYYSNIVGKYSKMVQKAINRLKDLPVAMIASTHGPVWRSDHLRIVNDYINWSSFKAEKGVVVVFGSMYGNTEKMADHIARELSEKGIRDIRIYDASKTHVSYIIRDIWKYKGVILGSCAYNSDVFPTIQVLLHKIENSELGDRLLATFGSSGWNKAGVKVLNEFAERINWEIIAPSAYATGAPDNNSIQQCNVIAQNMANKLNEIYG